LKLNLFGILNAGSFHDFIQKTEWITDADTGDITLIDSLNASQVGYRIDNLAKDSNKLRHVIADGELATCVYKASQTGYQPNITTSFWVFDLNQTGTLALARSYLNVAVAMNLIDGDAAKAKLTAAHVPLGRTIFNAQITLDDSLVDKVFFDQSGHARKRDEYERLGREAMLSTLPPDLDGDIFHARHNALSNDQLWKQMADAGSFPNVAAVLKPQFGNSPKFNVMAADIYGDYIIITWWASAMADVAAPLEHLRQYLKSQTITDPHNNTLSKLRGNLNKQLRTAISDAHDRFSQPWGLVVMALASGRSGDATFTISSSGIATTLSRKAKAAVAAGAGSNL
jgi:hypothetical protein